jgi:hypothetical protein
LFGKVAETVVGISPEQVILNNYRTAVPITSQAIAAAGLSVTPPEIAAIVSWKYRFLIYVTNDTFTGKWASFHVQAVEAAYPLN